MISRYLERKVTRDGGQGRPPDKDSQKDQGGVR